MTWIEDPLICFLLAGTIAFFVNFLAWKQGFFSLPQKSLKVRLSFLHLLCFFLLYLTCSLLLPLLSLKFYRELFSTYAAFVFAQLSSMTITLVFLLGAACLLPRDLLSSLLKRSSSSYFKDLSVGALTWFLGIPLVLAVEQLSELLIRHIAHFAPYEQVAVRYLKIAMSSPSLLVSALLSILIIAPCTEEFLFRGLLQSYLKKFFSTKGALLLSSFAFALFHLSASQGLGNIPLAASLFTFSCFLGFVYEKQQSLLSSIALHVTFNSLSAARIIFFS